MSTFIKVGFWEKLCKPCKGYKGWLNLDEFVTKIVTALIPPIPTPAYKVYTALLTQSGTSAPTAIVLENTLGVTVSFNYGNIGRYVINFSSPVFNVNTSTMKIANYGNNAPNDAMLKNNFLLFLSNTLYLYTQQTLNNNTITRYNSENNMLNNTLLEIKVYN